MPLLQISASAKNLVGARVNNYDAGVSAVAKVVYDRHEFGRHAPAKRVGRVHAVQRHHGYAGMGAGQSLNCDIRQHGQRREGSAR